MPLVVHGTIVLLLAQLVGVVYFRSLGASAQASAAQAWRMSHAATSAGAVFLIALGPVVPHLAFAPIPSPAVVGILIASTYLLSIGTVVAAASGTRGITARRPNRNAIVFAMYIAGAIGSFGAAVGLLYGALRAY